MKTGSCLTALTLAFTMALAACATAPARPDWVSGASQKYPSGSYLTGIGEAGTQEEARDRARADLAKIFEVSIQVDTEDILKHKSITTEAKSRETAESSTARTIVTRSDQIIQGIQIAELWRDPASGSHYALAVLPRQKTANSLRREIERLDETTRTNVLKARNSADLLIKIGTASRALDAQIERGGYQKSLKIVELTGRGAETKWPIEKLRADLDGLLKRLRIGVRVEADPAGELNTALAGGLAAAGFLIEPGQNPDFILEGALHMDDLGLRDGWYWIRGTLEIRLYEPASDRMRGTRQWNIKASAQQRAGARRRTMDQVESIMKNELRGAIIGFAAG